MWNYSHLNKQILIKDTLTDYRKHFICSSPKLASSFFCKSKKFFPSLIYSDKNVSLQIRSTVFEQKSFWKSRRVG